MGAQAARPTQAAATAGQGGDVPEWLAAVSGKSSYEWARRSWDRCSAIPGAWYDAALADEIVRQWPILFKLTQDRFAGLPFELNDWQEIIVRLLVGWRQPDEQIDPVTKQPIVHHVRVYRRLMLWVPRKNGKSEFLAALGLLFFLVDGVVDGEG